MNPDDVKRREILRAAVATAVLCATPLSFIEAAAEEGKPVVLDLADGTQLKVEKSGERHQAQHMDGDKIIEEAPTGSFTLASGEVVELKDGLVTKADVQSDMNLRGGSEAAFVLFWQ